MSRSINSRKGIRNRSPRSKCCPSECAKSRGSRKIEHHCSFCCDLIQYFHTKLDTNTILKFV